MAEIDEKVAAQVSNSLSDVLQGEAVEEGFAGYIMHTPQSLQWKQDHNADIMTKLWANIPQENHVSGLKVYANSYFDSRNVDRVDLLAGLLEAMAEKTVLQPKLICETLLDHDKMTHNNRKSFIRTFKLIRKIVGGVDYKGCRDLLRMILQKQSIDSLNASSLPQVEAVTSVVSYILDRNACLLPSYLAVNEITKISVDVNNWPHWKMGKLLSDFVHSFKPVAQMVTISGRSHLLPVVGHSVATNNVWRLNSKDLRFSLSGPLPYSKEIQEPQSGLLRYVLEQPYSRDMVGTMLGLNKQVKQRCEVLEEQLVNLVVSAMEHADSGEGGMDPTLAHLLWQHLSSQLIYFVLFQFASFPHMVVSLYEKLSDFLPVLKLYDLLYPDNSSIAVPDISTASSTHTVAATCIWIHLNMKATSDNVQLQRPIPHALREHQEALGQLGQHLENLKQNLANRSLPNNDYRIPLLCNAYSTNPQLFNLPMSILVESICGNNSKNTCFLPGNLVAAAPTQPLSMNLLDSLTVHAKMSLIHSIVSRVIRHAKNNKSTTALAPALVETYSRLLVYMEIESLGIKGFISQLLPTVFTSQAWGILHTLLEMFSYRLHHIQPHYRVQLLGHLHTLSSMPMTNQNQLHLCVESTALRLITGLGSAEVQPQLSRIFSEPKATGFLSQDSEELNRVLVLTLARAMHVTGSESFSSTWCKDILSAIIQSTPHSWPSHTTACFPACLNDFFKTTAIPREDKNSLKRNVDTEYKKWRTMANENDIIAHFSMQGTPPLFLCIIWKSLIEDNRIQPIAYRVLERIGPRALSAHLRTFCDFIVFEFCLAGNQNYFQRYIEAINDMIWKNNILTIDRLVLCLALRNLENNEARLAFYIIYQILVRSTDFKNRVSDFLQNNTPDHWLQSNWHEKHMNFHKMYPEKFFYEGIQDLNSPIQHQYLPVYFGNICLRFIPVLDILIHRLIEMLAVQKFLESILDNVGGLYKFHDRPITYLYNTLHYYDSKLAGRAPLKRRLVNTIVLAHRDIHADHWFLTEDYQKYLQLSADSTNWIPEQDYYIRLIGRLVETIDGKSPFPNCDWRFNEFPNPAAHALHATCVELMALPVSSQAVGSAVLDVVLKSSTQLPRDKLLGWINAVGLVLTALPETYWNVLNEKILEMIKSPMLMNMGGSFFEMFDFMSCQSMFVENTCSYLVAVAHSVWHHAGIGQLSVLPQFVKEKVKPCVQAEEQFLFLLYLIGPFLSRFNFERTRCLLDLTVEMYEILASIDKSCEHLHHMDIITDFLYHIKYMFVGDGVKNDVDKVIRTLRPALQLRLRFISHTAIDETPVNTPREPLNPGGDNKQKYFAD
ncbi:mediator of RNA polymerase II transcription subunit 23-like isoform X2 [Mya arenaria]|uniref:mediator of RNA polymerase II transcription subunit 23-like isoform X2 n=1 Tax=Mya arenaria TaxID=6604 RepID=UPI0022E3F8F7|nr:mediator of RNA polymerase II transcription subunit 23-like isoform X2 [Mya arenaria]